MPVESESERERRVFKVVGPLSVPTRSKFIDVEHVKEFWAENKLYAKHRGVYLLAIKAGKGFTPIYVGKTNKSFVQEVFTKPNLHKYNSALAEYRRCSVVTFLMVYPTHRGVLNARYIDHAETFMIQLAQQANPLIKNVRKVNRLPEWAIEGINDSRRGQRSQPVKNLRRALNL